METIDSIIVKRSNAGSGTCGLCCRGQAAGSEMEIYEENRAADADGFVIEDGVLRKYTGTAAEVVIPDGVTSIGGRAFYYCNGLTSITIPSSVTSIEGEAFKYCSGLTSITIPSSVTNIEHYAFEGCSGLTGIKVEEGNPVYDSRENCNAIIETESDTLIVGCKNTIIPSGVTSIGNGAFSGCSGLTSITIPSSVTSIGRFGFVGCSGLTSIIIPPSVTSIGESAFTECSGLTSITISEGVDSIEGYVFTECSGLKNITIPSSVTSIGEYAFIDCSGLTSLKVEEGNPKYNSRENCNAIIETESNTLIVGCKNTIIPSGVIGIGNGAFWGCSGLTSIIIPSSVTNIGHHAFTECSGLTSIIIPKSVTSIGGAFKGCSGLISLKVEEGNPVYDSRENCNAIIETESDTLIVGCKNTIIPSGVTSIWYGAFSGCSGLTSLTIPSSVASIGNYAFSDCRGLTSITIPSSVTNIETGAFKDCSEELTIYGTAGSYAETYANKNKIKFSTGMPPQSGQTSAKKKISANNVTVSPISYAYDGKAKKPAVTVKDGDTVLKAGTDYTVSYDNNTNAGTAKVTVTGKGNYEGTVTKTFIITVRKGTSHVIGAYKYQVTGKSTVSVTGISDKKTVKVKIPKTVTIGGKTFKVASIGKNVFKKNMKITSVEIGDNVKTIGASAFEGCAKLAKVTLGKGVTEIGSSIFKNCKKLGTITIKSASLKKVGKNALKGIKATAKIKVPKKKLSVYKKLLKNKGQGKNVRITK